MDKKKIIGIALFISLILIIIGIKFLGDKGITTKNLTTIYVATGGGKEDFIADPEVNKILNEKYKINVVYDSWSNGKTITWPLIREKVSLGNQNIINKMQYGDEFTINSEGVSKYDALFTSDQRFYDYYKLSPNGSLGESDRYTVLDGGLTLNTPIVIYSWKEVVDVLEKEGMVTLKDGVYYLSNMNKLIQYIIDGKKWSDIGLNGLFRNISIDSTDPVSSSPGATYYGLLLATLSGGMIDNQSMDANLSKLKTIYQRSGYMNNTPADLFQRYLTYGYGEHPMIVDYEKSIIEFANSNPTKFKQVKDKIVLLYPTPTSWNSHCLAVFTENGKKLLEAFEDPEIQQIAWSKYGFRTGITGGSYDVSEVGVGIPDSITSTTPSLKMDNYNKLIDYLKN